MTSGSKVRLSGGTLTSYINNCLLVTGGERVARAAVIPGDGQTPSLLEDASKFRQRVRRSKPVKRLGTEDEIDGLRTQPGGFGSSRHPGNVRVGCGCAPHGFPRFNGYDANSSFAEQTRRFRFPLPHLRRRAARAVRGHRDGADRFGRVGWTISDVVGCSIAESPDRIAIVTACHSSEHQSDATQHERHFPRGRFETKRLSPALHPDASAALAKLRAILKCLATRKPPPTLHGYVAKIATEEDVEGLVTASHVKGVAGRNPNRLNVRLHEARVEIAEPGTPLGSPYRTRPRP